MKFRTLATLLLSLSPILAQTTVDIFCDFHDYDGNMNVDLRDQYNCFMTEAVSIPNAAVTLNITGPHLEGRNNSDVTMVRTPNYPQHPVDFAVIHPQLFDVFPNLEELVLAYAGLRELRLERCQRLTRVYVHHGLVAEIPTNVFANCSRLRHLDLGFNPIAAVHADAFRGLAALEILNLSGNARVFVGNESLADARQLRELRIVGGAAEIEVGALEPVAASLRVLELSSLGLRFAFVRSLLAAGLDRLVALDLSGSDFSDAAAADLAFFGGGAELESLTLDGAGLVGGLGAGGMAGLGRLRSLSLAHNALEWLDGEAFAGCAALAELWLSSNELADLGSLPFRPLAALEQLHLAFNPLESLPGALFAANAQLRLLNVVGCRLRALAPATLRPLPQLRLLAADHNQLAALEPLTFAAATCRALDLLSLAHNRLRALATDVFAAPAPSLRTLLLNHNRLARLQPDLFRRRLVAVQWLGGAGNECLNASVTGVGQRALELCFQRWEEEEEGTTTEGGASDETTTPGGSGEKLRSFAGSYLLVFGAVLMRNFA